MSELSAGGAGGDGPCRMRCHPLSLIASEDRNQAREARQRIVQMICPEGGEIVKPKVKDTDELRAYNGLVRQD